MENTKREHLKKWVIAGYGAIIIVVMITIIYIATLLFHIRHARNEYRPTNEKIRIVTNTLLLLQECDAAVLFTITSGNTDMVGKEFEQKFYDVYEFLGLLRRHTNDSLSLSRIDEVEYLISLKMENSYQLISTKQEMEQLYAKSLDREMSKKRSTVKAEDVKTYKESQTVDTLIVNRQQKGFFKRLAEVFSPAKMDTAKRTNTVNIHNVDSLAKEYDPNMAVSKALNSLQRNISRNMEAINAKLIEHSTSLLESNQTITVKINHLLNDIKDEETQETVAKEVQRRIFIETNLTRLSIISIIALAVILCFLVLILKEIAKARNLRLELEKAKQFAEELLLSREKLMLMISHDIRAPLSSILSSVELLKNTNPDSEQNEYIDNMSVSAGHTLSLVNDLLDFHRLESGKMDIQQQTIKVATLFGEIYACFKPISDAKGLKFEFNMKNEGEGKLYIGDPLRIKQAIGNLLSNAIKFTSQGGVYLNVETVNDENGDTRLCISVKDEGSGIAVEEQGKIFGEFTRLADSEVTDGFGLGLSISSKLISLMNGTISLESEPGQGTTFTVKMILRQTPEQEISDLEDKTVHGNTATGRKINCIVIDDDPLQLKYITSLLKQGCINAIPCSNTDELMDMLKNTCIDFIITDMLMPGIDGISLLNLIQKSKDIPVIAVSASTAEEEEYYTGKGFYGYLCKPVTPQALMQTVNRLLSSRNIVAETYSNRPVDFSPLTSFAENSEDAKAIIKTFIAEATKNSELLRKSYQNGDRIQVSQIAHKLAPTMMMLAENETVSNLKSLEVSYLQMNEDEWKGRLNSCIQRIISIIKQSERVE